jgi:hypothetical protein
MKIWSLSVTWENTILWEILKTNPSALSNYEFNGSYINSWGDFDICFENKKMRDCMDAGVGAPGLSKKAVEILMPLIEKNVQLLPLKHPAFEYFRLNVLQLIDAIDYEKSTFRKLSNGRLLTVKEYVFKPDCLIGVDIFKVPYFTTNVYVSDRFRQTVLDNKLTGFDFIKLWDYEASTEVELLEPIEWQDPIVGDSITFSEAMKLAEKTGQIYRSGKWRMKFNDKGNLLIGELDNRGQVFYDNLVYIPPILITQKWYLDIETK